LCTPQLLARSLQTEKSEFGEEIGSKAKPSSPKAFIKKQMEFRAALQALQGTQTQLLDHARKKAVPRPQVQWLQ